MWRMVAVGVVLAGCGSGSGRETWVGELVGESMAGSPCTGTFTEDFAIRFDLDGRLGERRCANMLGTFVGAETVSVQHEDPSFCRLGETVVSAVITGECQSDRIIVRSDEALIGHAITFTQTGNDASIPSQVLELEFVTETDDVIAGTWSTIDTAASGNHPSGTFTLRRGSGSPTPDATTDVDGSYSDVLFTDTFDTVPSAAWTGGASFADSVRGNPPPSMNTGELRLAAVTPQPAPSLVTEVDVATLVSAIQPNTAHTTRVRWIYEPLQLIAEVVVAAVHDGAQVAMSVHCNIAGATNGTPVAVATNETFHRVWLRYDGTNLRCGYDAEELATGAPTLQGAAGVTLELVDTGAARFDNVRVARL